MQNSLRSYCTPAAAGDPAPPGLAGLAPGALSVPGSGGRPGGGSPGPLPRPPRAAARSFVLVPTSAVAPGRPGGRPFAFLIPRRSSVAVAARLCGLAWVRPPPSALGPCGGAAPRPPLVAARLCGRWPAPGVVVSSLRVAGGGASLRPPGGACVPGGCFPARSALRPPPVAPALRGRLRRPGGLVAAASCSERDSFLSGVRGFPPASWCSWCRCLAGAAASQLPRQVRRGLVRCH